MMLPIVMDNNFNRLAIIDYYMSFIWATRYYTCGEFELCVPVTESTTTLFQNGYYILRDDDPENVGVIEKIRIEKLQDDEERVIISGRFISSILSRRIIAVQTQVYGSVQSCIQLLINQNAISPSIAARTIPNLVFESDLVSSYDMQAQFTGDNLLEAISEICRTYGIGFKMIITNDHKFKFILFEGTNRSYGQHTNPYVVFSNEYENLISSEYEESQQEMVTDVLIAGEGEGLDRKTLWVSKDSPSGLNRFELYQDARNTSTNEGEISDETYYNQLRGEALESITTFTSAFAGEVDFSNIKYGTDIKIGDVCTIKNNRWGLSINVRLVEVIESVSESGKYTITPSFGNYSGEEDVTIRITEEGAIRITGDGATRII